MASGDGEAQDNSAAFAEKYIIDTGSRLKEFDTAGGEAYMVRDAQDQGRSLYALVHDPKVPVRRNVYKVLSGGGLGNIVSPVDRGVMAISGHAQRQRMVTIFDRPKGGPLMGPDGKLHPKVNPANLRQVVVLGLLRTLASLHKKNVTHRSVHPQRMYFATTEGRDLVLGECCSCPAGYGQPAALDALELAFADQYGRGSGSPSSDFYQAGAALMCLYMGKKLWEGRDEASLMMARVNQGSFWALTGGTDIPGAIGTAIRGLMGDEWDERWDAADLLDWYEGMVKQKRIGLKTWALNKPTSFNGVSYVDRRLLADAMARNPEEAASFLRKLDFFPWAQTSLKDEIINEKLQKRLGLTSEGQSNFSSGNRLEDHRIVARFCLFLYPQGPVRFKGLAFFLNGFPGMLAHAYAEDDRDFITSLVEFLDVRFLASLRDVTGDGNKDFISQTNALREYSAIAKSQQLGSGMEKVLYMANPSLPCQAIRFKENWAGSIREIILILDKISDLSGTRSALLDRHVSAYMAAHGGGLEREFNKLAAAQNDPAKQSLLITDLFGALQRATKIPLLPNLTNRLVDGMGPALRSLKNKKRREQVQAMLDKVKKGGSISKLTSEVNMAQVAALDAREFSKARQDVAKLEREKARLTQKIQPNDPEAIQRGYQVGRWIAFLVFAGVAFVTIS